MLPLTITVIATQNAQGIVVLRSAGHSPPVNTLTAMCGAGSLVAALFGCVSTCLTGPSNALLVSSGTMSRQWIGGIILGVMAILFGVFAPVVTNLLIAHRLPFLARWLDLPCCAHCSQLPNLVWGGLYIWCSDRLPHHGCWGADSKYRVPILGSGFWCDYKPNR